MNRFALSALVALSTIIVPQASAGTAGSGISVDFSDGAVTASHITIGGSVAFLGISREPAPTTPPMIRNVTLTEVIVDEDRDGVVRLDLGSTDRKVGIWAVVDVESGSYAVGPTPGYDVENVGLDARGLKRDNAGQLRKFEWPLSEMEILLVRPGVGAWYLYAAKHGPDDEQKDSPDALRIDVEKMSPLGGASEKAKGLRNGDVLAIIDPRWMQYGVLEVGK
jgi:hypothetical protein